MIFSKLLRENLKNKSLVVYPHLISPNESCHILSELKVHFAQILTSVLLESEFLKEIGFHTYRKFLLIQLMKRKTTNIQRWKILRYIFKAFEGESYFPIRAYWWLHIKSCCCSVIIFGIWESWKRYKYLYVILNLESFVEI